MSQIINCRDARGLGRIRYFTGLPCLNGHVAERLVSNHQCCKCAVAKTVKRSQSSAGKEYLREYRQRDYVKAKNSARDKEWRARNREYHLERLVCWKFGLKPGEYGDLLARQGGVCAICGDKPGRKRLAVDHDHATGIVRGLLCDGCNGGLGLFKDNPQALDRAAEYLQQHKEGTNGRND